MRALRPTSSVHIRVRVWPEACGDEVVGWANGILRLHVMATPGRGQANSAVEALLAEVLGIARGQVNVVLGHSTAQKLVQIDGFDETDVDRELPGRLAGETGIGRPHPGVLRVYKE